MATGVSSPKVTVSRTSWSAFTGRQFFSQLEGTEDKERAPSGIVTTYLAFAQFSSLWRRWDIAFVRMKDKINPAMLQPKPGQSLGLQAEEESGHNQDFHVTPLAVMLGWSGSAGQVLGFQS